MRGKGLASPQTHLLHLLFYRLLSSSQCRYLLEGHSGCVTGVVSLSHLLADDVDQGGPSGSLIASCGSDRRVLLWDTSCSAPAPASDYASKRGLHSVDDEKARKGATSGPPVIEGRMLCVSGIAVNTEGKQRSAAGPLTALCISPAATSVSRHRQHQDSTGNSGGREHRSFVLAAACAGESMGHRMT
jgi:WD40 repeat protein